MSKDIAEFKAELSAMSHTELVDFILVLDALIESREEVLLTIPMCPIHGFCLPYFKQWIENAKALTPYGIAHLN